MSNLIGQRLGKYQITSLLGKGGVATVYRATREPGNLDVAVKVIKPTLVEVGDFLDRFKRESLVTETLNHPNILKVLDYGQAGPAFYMVMPLASGSLADLMEHQPLSYDDI